MRINQAWYMLGGGRELLNEFYKNYNVVSLLAGNTGCQMGGWFRKEIAIPSMISRGSNSASAVLPDA